jgi:hypothetical protein
MKLFPVPPSPRLLASSDGATRLHRPRARAPDRRPADVLRRAYLARVNEALEWYLDAIKPGEAPHPRADRVPSSCAARATPRLAARARADGRAADPATCSGCFPGPRSPTSGATSSRPRPGRDPRPWRTYFPMRGDTENHWAMYYASLYLMAELYPDDPGDTWFTARAPRRISPRPASTSSTGWISPRRSGRASSTPPTTSANTPSRCSTSPPGPRIRRCASAGA